MSGYNSELSWAQGALTPAQRTLYDVMMAQGTCSEAQAMEQITGQSVYDLAGKAKNRFANDCAEIEALWQKCEKSGDFSAFQADVTRRFAAALEEDRKSQPVMQDY